MKDRLFHGVVKIFYMVVMLTVVSILKFSLSLTFNITTLRTLVSNNDDKTIAWLRRPLLYFFT